MRHLASTLALGILVLPAAAAAAECPERLSEARVASSLDEALVSFAVMDEEAFERASDQAIASVECLDVPMTPSLAASLHRVRGIRLLISGQDEDARLALEAAARLAPDHQLSTTIAPAGGRVAVAWEAARASGPVERVALPPVPSETVELRVDGSVASDRPAVGPYVLQLTDAGALSSRYVVSGWPEDLLPAPLETGTLEGSTVEVAPEPVAPVPEPAPLTDTPPVTADSGAHGSKALLWAGVATGGVAAGLYGTSAVSRLSYDQNPTDGGRTLTNGTYFASVGTAVLSGVLVTTFFATR